MVLLPLQSRQSENYQREGQHGRPPRAAILSDLLLYSRSHEKITPSDGYCRDSILSIELASDQSAKFRILRED
jgi:hypothetical protein